MQIPLSIFVIALWASLGAVAAGALYLLVVLLKEWARKELW